MEETGKPRRWWTWGVIVLVLLVAYPLSLGPVQWLNERGLIGQGGPQDQFLVWIYYPLSILDERVPEVHDWFMWYTGLWI